MFYEYEEQDEDNEAIYKCEGQDEMENVFDVSNAAIYDHMHPTKAGLDAALKQKFGH